MATRRGRLLQQQWLGLQALRLPLGGVGAAPGSDRFRSNRLSMEVLSTVNPDVGDLCRLKVLCVWICDTAQRGPGSRATAFRAPGTQQALGEGPRARPCSHCPAWLDSMPAEVLLKILSYLDAAALLCMGCVNRRFYHLANDKYNWRADAVGRTAGSMSLLSVEDREAGHWKREYVLRRMASLRAALAQVLKPVNLYTGLPEKTKEALRLSGIGWVVILREKSGREHVLEHVDLLINESSVTVSWYGKAWPCLAALSTLDLCGLMPVFTDWPKPPTKNGQGMVTTGLQGHTLPLSKAQLRHVCNSRLMLPEHSRLCREAAVAQATLSEFFSKNRKAMIMPRWCSLVAKYSVSNMTDSAVIGCDRFVRLFRLDPGLLVGLWKREEELAFVTANLHISHLVERSTLGSATVPYELPPHGALSDDSPGHGLRGYQLHLDLHSGGAFCLCSTFGSLFTNTGCIEDGRVKLVVIHLQNSVEHLPLVGEVGLCWKTESIDGCVKSCSVMDVTLLDEYGKPFWCFSSPVCLRAPPGPHDGPHSTGPTSCIDYEDAAGAVHVDLARIEETGEHFIVGLELRLSLAKINRWFGTHY